MNVRAAATCVWYTSESIVSERCWVWTPRSSADVHEILKPSNGRAMIEEFPRDTEIGASST